MADSAESILHNDAQELLKEIKTASLEGGLSSSLRRKVESDPFICISLINMLLDQLETKQREFIEVFQSRFCMSIVPILHMINCVVIQSEVTIPNSVYQNLCTCLRKLLIVPLPYSCLALQTLRNIKMEMNTPGALYVRRVIREHSLKNEHFNLQEKVFLLAATKELSAPLEVIRQAYAEAAGSLKGARVLEKNVILHVLHSGLEITDKRNKLARVLEALDDIQAKKHFCEVVAAVKESLTRGAGGHTDYLNKLQDIYQDILTESKQDPTGITVDDCLAVCSTMMPYPAMEFHMWEDEEHLWNLLMQFTLQSESDEEEKNKRDSGIERVMKESSISENGAVGNSALKRRNCYRKSRSMDKLSLVKDKIEGVPENSAVKEERSHTARVVVLGDDCVLGRLARAYHSLREKESKRNMLTKKLNLQLYYIPLTKVQTSGQSADSRFSVASYLKGVDPCYNNNITILVRGLSKLSATPPSTSETAEKDFLDYLWYYLHCGTLPVNFPLYSVKLACDSPDGTSTVETVFVSHLTADIEDFKHLKGKSLKEMSSGLRKSNYKHCTAVMSISYTKVCLSKRNTVVGCALMTSGVMIKSELAASTSGGDYLAVNFDTMHQQNIINIQAKTINIKTLEHYRLCVCLDRDTCKTYNKVQRLEIFPCLDPGCNIRPKFSASCDRELPLSRYLDKVLSLPINTFTGVTV